MSKIEKENTRLRLNLSGCFLSYFAKFRRKKIACKKRFEEKREMNKKIATPRNTMRSEKNGNIDREEFISSSYVWTRAIV